jgi:hypothetical protein
MSEEKKFSRNINVTQREYKSNLNVDEAQKVAGLKKAGDKIYGILKKLDLFGKPINLRYNGNDNFTSLIGAFVSIAVLGVIVLFFGYSLGVFLGRKAPTYSSISETKSIPDDLDLSSITEPIDFTVGLDIFDQNNSGSVFDPTIFSLDIKRVFMSMNKVTEEQTYDYIDVPCNSSYFFSKKLDKLPKGIEQEGKNLTYYDFFKMSDNQGNDTAICFPLNKMNDTRNNVIVPTVLSGTDTSDTREYVQISIGICKNGTLDAGQKCQTLEEIKQKIDYYNVRFYFTQHVFVANDSLQNPVVNSTTFFNFPIQKYFRKTYNLNVQKNKVLDSWNLLSTNFTQQNIFSFSGQDIAIDFIQEGVMVDKELLVIIIKIDNVTNTYIRKFTNIKDFFIGVVGILNGIMAGGAGFGKFINGMLLKVDLINRSFYLIENDSGVKKVNGEGEKKIGGSLISGPKNQEMTNLKNVENLDPPFDNKSIDKTNRTLLKEKEKDVNVTLHRINTKGSEKNEENLPDGSGGEKSPEDEPSKPKGNILNPYYNDQTLILPTINKKFNKFKMSFAELIMKLLPCFKSKNLIVKKKIFEDCGAIIESFFDIERIVGILREYQDLRNVVLSQEEYAILKQLTTPKVEINDDQIHIKKVEKINVNEKQLKKGYQQFVQSINRMIKTPYITPIENNLLEIHRMLLLSKPEENKEEKKQ